MLNVGGVYDISNLNPYNKLLINYYNYYNPDPDTCKSKKDEDLQIITIPDALKKSNFIKRLKIKIETFDEDLYPTFVYKISHPLLDDLRKQENELESNISGNLKIDFKTLWDYCQFIRFAEKILNYKNDTSGIIYVDSTMYDIEERRIVFNFTDSGISYYLKLTRDRDPITSDRLHITNLIITRNYGKKLRNEFIIVNNNVKYHDDSDFYLIRDTVKNMNETMVNEMKSIYNKIDDKFLDYHLKELYK